MGLAWPNRVGLHSRIFLPVCRNGGLAELELDVEEAFVLDYEVRNLIVAEYGVLDQRGLVSLSGIFSAIRVAEFPATVTPRVFAEVFPAPQEAGAVEVTFSGSSCGNPPTPFGSSWMRHRQSRRVWRFSLRLPCSLPDMAILSLP